MIETRELFQAVTFKIAILMIHLQLRDILRELGMARIHLFAQGPQLILQP